MRDPIALADSGPPMVLPTVDADDTRSRRALEPVAGWILGKRQVAKAPQPRLADGSRADAFGITAADRASSRRGSADLAARGKPVADPLAGRIGRTVATGGPEPETVVDRMLPPRGGDGTTSVIHLGSFKSWKEFVRGSFPWLELRNCGGFEFEADVTLHRLGGGLFSTIRAGACEAVRSLHATQVPETGYIKVMWQLSNQTEVEQGGRTFRLDAGQVGVCDTSRPYRLRLSESARLAVLLVPCDAFPGWQFLGPQVYGRRVTDSIATRAALAALMSLNALQADVVANEGGPVFTAVKWMLSSTLIEDPAVRGSESACETLLAKARRHIVEHVADPSLGPDQVASALCMSRRSLYLLFKGRQLTPSKMILDIRLNQAKRSLEDPGQAHQKMTHIAMDAGFTDYATFSRLFKARFGITPSEFRSRGRLALCA